MIERDVTEHGLINSFTIRRSHQPGPDIGSVDISELTVDISELAEHLGSYQHTPGTAGNIIKLMQVFMLIKVPNQHDTGVQLLLKLKLKVFN